MDIKQVGLIGDRMLCIEVESNISKLGTFLPNENKDKHIIKALVLKTGPGLVNPSSSGANKEDSWKNNDDTNVYINNQIKEGMHVFFAKNDGFPFYDDETKKQYYILQQGHCLLYIKNEK